MDRITQHGIEQTQSCAEAVANADLRLGMGK